ncbi:indolepyruvate ferredoxin oxidoreductase beta subunit [Desulfocicer vacuolatum DSM 3385]|uniref:Indolepyruvate ferredoxin oxidoreductase beta subunit n=1 Tax=Desulfocicer vacuolatum DSM 3385 TaxID=1121400 RepID=A0A1W2AK16_9BACT|nr:2-oxoacid:acceptor oxidoreductase family protein [Desulfocicer vacuolatum]SMC61007.1 indolepyruvate ferredoxin oxidoreductase beta subunit [Desulfocicer vacuolatum DSM 3385]
MNQQIVISGVGGQGVLFITGLLAKACMAKGSHVLTSETHGMAQRGGTVISHLKIGDYASPLIRPGNADLLIVLKSENLAQHRDFLNPRGKAVVNAQTTFEKSASTAITLDADKMAEDENNPGSVNLYMLGGALAVTQVCSLYDVKEQIKNRLQGKPEALLTGALNALDKGYNQII